MAFRKRGAILCAFAFALGGCSSTATHDRTPDAAAPDLDAGPETGSFDGSFGDVEGPGDSGGLACSWDLRSVVDGNGALVTQCGEDQGCAAGECVPACDAAAASHGNIACDFVLPTPSFLNSIKPPCFAMFVANNWPRPAAISVSWNGSTYDATEFGRIADVGTDATEWPPVPAEGVGPGQVAVLFLSDDPESVNGGPLKCPVTPAISQPGGTALWTNNSAATGVGQAFHITTSMPVSAYDILPYGGAKTYLPSAELVLPTTAWGTNYMAVVAPKGTQGDQYGQIIAASDGTNVTILPNVDLPDGDGVTGASQNSATTYSLNAGEFIQWQPTGEMSGSIISADKPIAFAGGQGYLCLSSKTSTGGGCDSGHQMVPPITALGFEYAVAPYKTRMPSGDDESIPYRFVGAVDGTNLTYDPPIDGAPDSLSSGQLVDFQAVGPFVVRSQDKDHPFYVGQMMTGSNVTGTTSNLGDEEWVNIFPPAQFLPKYVFFTDPTYPTTNLVVVRAQGAGGNFADVNIDCAGSLSEWTPFGSGKYELAYLDLVRNGTPNGECDNGPHIATSDAPFSIVVWGLDRDSSYAYQAGGNLAAINKVVVNPIPH